LEAMSNPFVFAVMNAFRGKLPKPDQEKSKLGKRDEAKSAAQPPPPPQAQG